MDNNTTEVDAPKPATDEDASHALAVELVARHGVRKIPGDLLAKHVWTAGDIEQAIGLTPDEIEELRQSGWVRPVPFDGTGNVTIRDDIPDLLGVRNRLPDDTLKGYLDRCRIVGTVPDVFVVRHLAEAL